MGLTGTVIGLVCGCVGRSMFEHARMLVRWPGMRTAYRMDSTNGGRRIMSDRVTTDLFA